MVMNKSGLRSMDFVFYNLVRSAFGVALIIPYGLAVGSLIIPEPKITTVAVAAGVMDLGIAMALFLYALKRIQAHQVIPLAGTAPLWAVLAATLFLGEPLRWFTILSAALVILGSYLLVPRSRSSCQKYLRVGVLAAIGSAIFIGMGDTVLAKYCLASGMTPAAFQFVLMFTGTLFWGLVAMFRGRRFSSGVPAWRGIRFALITAFGGFFLAPILWFSALSATPASLLSPLRSLVILFSFGFSVTFLREKASRRSVVGVVLIVAGTTLASILGQRG